MAEKTIAMELVRSGFAVDGRGFSREIIEQMAANTLLLQGTSKMMVPVQRDHPSFFGTSEDGEAVEGSVSNLRTKAAADNGKELILEGDVTLSGGLLDDFNAGKLPKRSIGLVMRGFLPDGRMVGANLDHLALLGKTPPAFPNLEPFGKDPNGVFIFTQDQRIEAVEEVQPGIIEKTITQLNKALGQFTNKLSGLFGSDSEDTQAMPKEVIDKLNLAIGTIEEAIALMGDAPEKDEPPAEEAESDQPKEDEQEEETTEEAAAESDELAKTKLELALAVFSGLRLPKDQKANFVKIAASQGVDFAKAVYAAQASNQPADGTVLGTVNGKADSEEKQLVQDYMKGFGFTEEEALERVRGEK